MIYVKGNDEKPGRRSADRSFRWSAGLRVSMFTAEKLSRDIELLRHGGSEGIELFMRTAQQLFHSVGENALQSWLTIAAPALPEQERVVVLTALFSSIFEGLGAVPLASEAGTTVH